MLAPIDGYSSHAVLTGLLYLLPALTLALVLLARRYPGERALLALRGERRAVRRRRAPLRVPTPRPAVLILARGGLLLARSLAVRPPPAPRAAS
jgi:hypothetical protein